MYNTYYFNHYNKGKKHIIYKVFIHTYFNLTVALSVFNKLVVIVAGTYTPPNVVIAVAILAHSAFTNASLLSMAIFRLWNRTEEKALPLSSKFPSFLAYTYALTA